MAGAIFDRATPWFVHEARRWSLDDARAIAASLSPALQADGKVLDVGGGTGKLAGPLAEVVPCAVTILDSSAAMLRHAEAVPGVAAILGDAAAMPFDDAFDALIALGRLFREVGVVGEVERQSKVGHAFIGRLLERPAGCR